jgi:hypothetical protein
LTLHSEHLDSSQGHPPSTAAATTAYDDGKSPSYPSATISISMEGSELSGEPSFDLLGHMYFHASMLVRTGRPTPARVWYVSTHGEIPFYGPSRDRAARLLDSRYQDALRAIATGDGPSPRMSSRPAVASRYVSALGHLSHLIPTDEAYTAELTSLKRGQVSDRLQPPGRPRQQKRSPIAGGNVILLGGATPNS